MSNLEVDVIKPLAALKASLKLLAVGGLLICRYPKGNGRSDKKAGREESQELRHRLR